MTKMELSAVMERLEEYYRNFYFGGDKERILNAWYPMFRDDDAGEVARAVTTYICTEKYAPTIAGIKTIMADLRMAGQMTEMQAWQKVRTAIDSAGSRNDAIAAFGNLPSILQKLICNPSQLRYWRSCSDDTLEGVIASNVQRSYRELAKREAVFYAIPGQLQQEQKWRVLAPEQASLPEPEKEKTLAEAYAEAEEKETAFREIHGIKPNADYASRVAAFQKPLTQDEIKAFEAKQKKKDADRLERMRL